MITRRLVKRMSKDFEDIDITLGEALIEIRRCLSENFKGYAIQAHFNENAVEIRLLCAHPERNFDHVFEGPFDEMESLARFVVGIIDAVNPPWDEKRKVYYDLPEIITLEQLAYATLFAFSDIPDKDYPEIITTVHTFYHLDLLLRAFGASSELANMADEKKASPETQILA